MMTHRNADRNREVQHKSPSFVVQGFTLTEVTARTGLSERWIRELIKRHGLDVRKVPCAGRYRFVFSREDVERIDSIHQRNQAELQHRHPAFYAVVGKRSLVPTGVIRSPWSIA